MQDPLIGRQLANYRLERLLGRGGMASVYYALDVKLNRPAAVKVIDIRFRDSPTYNQRFLQEARTVAAWRHENILQVYYAGDEDGLFYFAMEYIDGSNLAQILDGYTQHGNLMPTDEVLRYGQAVARALDYAHSRGVIHRDVKPSNVLAARDGRIVLSDFGLAMDVQQGSLGEVFGTARYTAPEQARRSNSAVPQSDLYSLGVMLYQLLTGVVPFDDPSPASVALQQITLPPPSPRQVNPNLSLAVEAVLLKSLSKDPSARFQSGAELLDALEQALGRSPIPTIKPVISAGQQPPAESNPASFIQASQSNKSNRRIAWLAAGGCLVVILLTGGVIFGLIFTKMFSPSASALSKTQSVPASNMMATYQQTTPAKPTSAQPAASSPTVVLSPVRTQTVKAAPTVTSLPVAAATQTATSTLAPSATSAVRSLPTPSGTPKYITGRRFILFYNQTSFYMLQVGGYGGLIAPAAFERLDSLGLPTNRFDGDGWAEYHASTLGNMCMRLEIYQSQDYLRPAECENRYLATLWPAADDSSLFWTAKEGSTQFRVLWGKEEAGRCEIAAGICEVYLP